MGESVTVNTSVGTMGGSGEGSDTYYGKHLHVTFSTDYNYQGRYVETSTTFDPLWIYNDITFDRNSKTDGIPGVTE